MIQKTRRQADIRRGSLVLNSENFDKLNFNGKQSNLLTQKEQFSSILTPTAIGNWPPSICAFLALNTISNRRIKLNLADSNYFNPDRVAASQGEKNNANCVLFINFFNLNNSSPLFRFRVISALYAYQLRVQFSIAHQKIGSVSSFVLLHMFLTPSNAFEIRCSVLLKLWSRRHVNFQNSWNPIQLTHRSASRIVDLI